MRAPFLPLRQGTSSGRINSRIGAPAGRVFLIDGSRLRLARRLPERGNAIKFSQNRYPHAEAARAPTFLDDERWTTLASFRFRCSLLPCFRINLRISRFRRPMCIPRSLDIDGRNRKRCVILAVQHPFSLFVSPADSTLHLAGEIIDERQEARNLRRVAPVYIYLFI